MKEAVQSGEFGDQVKASTLVKTFDISYAEASALLKKLRSDGLINDRNRPVGGARGLSVDLPDDVAETHKKFGLRTGSVMAQTIDLSASTRT